MIWATAFVSVASYQSASAAVSPWIPLSFLPPGQTVAFCGEPMPLDDEDVRERLEKEFLLITQDRAQVILWLKRSKRYLTQIEAMLKENDMPPDLQYVAVIESSLLPHAGSSKGAMGFWQFLGPVGRKFGLTVDTHIDERRNLAASTAAAIRYLTKLRELLGAWTLAVAAYNMGENGLLSAISEQGTTDYYKLYLPLETQRFIFRIICVKMILSDPAAFGFDLEEEEYYPPVECDNITLTCRHHTPIRLVATAADTYYKMIKDLNPEIRGGVLPPGDYRLLIPKGKAEGFHPRFNELVEKMRAAQTELNYTVQSGDTLSGIADRFRVPLSSLVIWNRIDRNRPIHPGDRLTVFQSVSSDEPDNSESPQN